MGTTLFKSLSLKACKIFLALSMLSKQEVLQNDIQSPDHYFAQDSEQILWCPQNFQATDLY